MMLIATHYTVYYGLHQGVNIIYRGERDVYMSLEKFFTIVYIQQISS